MIATVRTRSTNSRLLIRVCKLEVPPHSAFSKVSPQYGLATGTALHFLVTGTALHEHATQIQIAMILNCCEHRPGNSEAKEPVSNAADVNINIAYETVSAYYYHPPITHPRRIAAVHLPLPPPTLPKACHEPSRVMLSIIIIAYQSSKPCASSGPRPFDHLRR